MAVARPLLGRSNNIVDNQQKRKQLKACALTRQSLDKDRLSELPDEILIHILSCLTMKEAGRTSLVSRRWKHLWTYIPTLIFESREIIDDCILDIKSFDVEGPRYLHWVDRVVSLYQAPTVDEVSVQFDINRLGSSSSDSIDNLIRFSMEKEVKRLQVDLSLHRGGNFPLRHTFNCLSLCNSLKSLALACVNITGEILESFLYNCQALEYLSVSHSETLLGLRVSSKSLKTLTVYRCYEINQLEIFAPNLVSVCYVGPKINVEFKSTPMLAEVSFGHDYAEDWGNSFLDLSGYLSQIEVLTLHPSGTLGDIIISGGDPVFSKLTKLDLTILPLWHEELDCIEYLIRICPFLHHFKLQLELYEGEDEEREGVEKKEAFPHHNLKILEIVGFAGYLIDLEIAAFLIDCAVSLDKIIVDPRKVLSIGSFWEFIETPEKVHAREQALLLRTYLKPATELQIL